MKVPVRKQGLSFEDDQLNGCGFGVFSVEGGKIGIKKEGCSPVSVLRKATICVFSSALNFLPNCNLPINAVTRIKKSVGRINAVTRIKISL